MANGAEDQSGREIRLLLLVIVIAVAGLVVLARFRFPAADIVAVTPTPSPLERIAQKPPFEELAAAVNDAVARIAPHISVVELEPVVTSAPQKSARKKSAAPAPEPLSRPFMPALHVRAGRWLVYQPKATKAARSAGVPLSLAGEDTAREMALVVPQNASGMPETVVNFSNAASAFSGMAYVLVFDAAREGPVAEPVFLPRLDAVTSPAWDEPLFQGAALAKLSPGTFVFTLDGRLIGLTIPYDGGAAIVPAATLDRLAVSLVSTSQ